jgi:hypothetical protein
MPTATAQTLAAKQGCALQPLCPLPLECSPGSCGSERAAQRGDARSRLALTLSHIPTAMCSLTTGAQTTTDQRFRWSGCVWSPPPESNRRPHPYHGTTRNRCAERRFPRSPSTVGAEVIGSLSAKLCALFQAMCRSSLAQAMIRPRDHEPGHLSPLNPGIYLHRTCYHHATSAAPSALLTLLPTAHLTPSPTSSAGASNFQAGKLDHHAATTLILLDPDSAPVPSGGSGDRERGGRGRQGARPAAWQQGAAMPALMAIACRHGDRLPPSRD